MQISFDKFLALTITIAAGANLSLGCVVESADDDDGSGGDSSSAGAAGNAETGAAGAAGLTESNGGSSALAGASGSAGSSTGVAGSAGSSTGAAGSAGSSTGVAGSAGSSTGVAGSTIGTAGAAGGAAETAGTAGAAFDDEAGGAAGAPSTEGTGGAAGSGGTCLSSDPADEGTGFDCSTLPYYTERCPNPSGEGDMSPLAAGVCWQYSEQRTESVRVLTDCLAAITVTAEGYCGAEHAAAVDACVAEMQARTCPSSAAIEACASISSACSAVSEEACVAELSVLSDTEITTYVEPCAVATAELSSTCEHAYRQCAGHPDLFVSVQDACDEVRGTCTDVDATTCESRLDIYGGGALYESTFYSFVVGCMQTEQEASSATCTAAFETCTSTWAD